MGGANTLTSTVNNTGSAIIKLNNNIPSVVEPKKGEATSKLVVGDKTFNIKKYNDLQGYKLDDTKEIHISSLNDVVVGVITTGYTPLSVFVQGNLTRVKEIPTDGKGIYDAMTLWGNEKVFHQSTLQRFKADFKNKTFTTEIEFVKDKNPTKKLVLNAQIEGNRFRGKADDLNISGGFYGAEGKEFGGLLSSDDKKTIGYFYGKKK